MKEVKKNERGNLILALALIKHLHNSGKLPEHVYLNIKREYEPKVKTT